MAQPTSGELPDELATLWYLIRRTAALMDQQGEALLRRELGVSLAQFLVLSVSTVTARPSGGPTYACREPGPSPILPNVADDFVDPVDWALANAAGFSIGRVAAMRADLEFRKTGRVRCGLRVIDGTQPGLSGRWRLGIASFSPRRLTFRRRWWRGPGECPPIEVVAIHGPPRVPSSAEILKLPGSIVRIQAPAATLEWAFRDRYHSAVFERLKVPCQ